MTPRQFIGPILMLLGAPVSVAALDEAQAPLLWQIEGAVPSYLFGTIHVADPRVLSLPDRVESAFQAAEVVYTEIPLDTSVQLGMAESAVLPEGGRLEEILDPDTVERINRYLSDVAPGLTIAPLSQLKVWALATTLQLLESQMKHPGKALDMELYGRADALGKEVGGLETVAEQLELMDGLNFERQVRLLEGTLDYLEQARVDGVDVVADLIDAYLNGDIDRLGHTLNEYLDDPLEHDSPLLERFITARNRKMAERIDKLLESDPGRRYFFAVGAGHFWGDQSLPQLLRDRGYTVRRDSGS